MSWINNLAGKAENFLNNLDNSAAQALNKSQDHIDNGNQTWKTEPLIVKEYDKFPHENPEFMPGNTIKSASLKLSAPRNINSSLNQKDDLFQFSSSKNEHNDFHRSRSDIFSNSKKFESMSDRCSSGYRTNFDDGSDKSYSGKIDCDLTVENDANIENKLLRSEISSLNQEISSLLQRNHKSEEETKRLRNQLDKVTSQLRDTDRKYRDVVSVKDDFVEMLKVKDNQISVLQSEMSLRKESANEINVVSDHRNKIIMLEQELRNKNESFEKLENEILGLQIAADDAKLKLAQTANNYEKVQSENRRKVEMISAQLGVAKQKNDSIQKELKDYKIKAAKILQMKEKVIASLKGNGEGSEDQLAPLGNFEELQQNNINLIHENDQMREEVARLRVELEHKDFDLQEQDQQMHTETESLRKNLDLLEEQLERERQMREDTDSDFRQLIRENRHLQEKYMREKADFHDHLAVKDEEVERMKLMLSTKQVNQTDQVVELDARVRSLTDTLIQKQASLDASKAAHYSMQIRLERTEMELDTLHKATIVPGTSADRRNPPSANDFVTITMRDAPITKNLKSAVNSVDKLSIRLGVFLRRYPPARLFFISYTILLHFWVLFVLLTYQPEMHSNPVGPNIPRNK